MNWFKHRYFVVAHTSDNTLKHTFLVTAGNASIAWDEALKYLEKKDSNKWSIVDLKRIE